MGEKILIITPVPITPPHSGNKKRILSICTELKNMGYELDLFYTGFDETLDKGHEDLIDGSIFKHRVFTDRFKFTQKPILRVKELFNGLRIRIDKSIRYLMHSRDSCRYNKSIFEYRNLSKLRLLRDQIKDIKYHAVIVNYAVFSFYFELFDSDVIRVIDMHDCLTDRYKIFLERGEEPVNWYSLNYRDEKKALNKADIVWAITPDEEKHYQNMLHHSNVTVDTLRHMTHFRRIQTENVKTKSVLMTGSNNRLNRKGLQWFLEKIWPEVHSKYPDSELIIAGTLSTSENSFEKVRGVAFYGKYDNDDEVYRLADICVNPMLEGTGLKIKTLEALSFGKRVLSTNEGATGLLDLKGAGLFCSDNPDEWIEEFDRVFSNSLNNGEFLENLERRIQEIYAQNINVLKKSLS